MQYVKKKKSFFLLAVYSEKVKNIRKKNLNTSTIAFTRRFVVIFVCAYNYIIYTFF